MNKTDKLIKIKGLFETHLFVENLERSIDFYTNILGLEQCYYEGERRTAFFGLENLKKQCWVMQPNYQTKLRLVKK
ncbi:MAG: VOC family protein [Saprospiraceae bacterium]|nr:VOC family protein [Saprospiraceae bacterium]